MIKVIMPDYCLCYAITRMTRNETDKQKRRRITLFFWTALEMTGIPSPCQTLEVLSGKQNRKKH